MRASRSSPARVACAIVATVLLLSSGAAVAQTQPEAVAVVVNPSVDVDNLTFAELRKIMLGERQFWTSGQPITIIVRGPVAHERTLVLQKVYKMTEDQYRQYWVAKVFRAEVTSGPRVVLSNDEAVSLVSVVEGAIAVVAAEDVPEGLRVLRIDGHLPGEPDYPLN